MKKILLVALMTLFVVSCSGRGRTSSTSTDPTNLNTGNGDNNNGGSGSTTTIQCVEHATLVNGTCVCDSGYKVDDQGNCIQQIANGSIKLAMPILSSNNNVYSFTLPVTDINNNPVPNGQIHCVYGKSSSGSGTPAADLSGQVTAKGTDTGTTTTTCSSATYNAALDCIDPHTLYKLPVTVNKSGTYCIKAIACDDAEGYTASDILVQSVVIP